MTNIWFEVQERLDGMGVRPLLGGLIPESATAELLGYSIGWFRRKAVIGESPVPFIRRGNRRLYRIDDIVRFVEEVEH